MTFLRLSLLRLLTSRLDPKIEVVNFTFSLWRSSSGQIPSLESQSSFIESRSW